MAGKTVVNELQLGDSAIASQNFVLKTNADGSAKLARGAGGNLGDILTIAADGEVSFPNGAAVSDERAGVVLSGSYVDFTIPAGVMKVELLLTGMSLSGSSTPLVRIGSGGLPLSTGYASACGVITATNACQVQGSTTDFRLAGAAAANSYTVKMTFDRFGTADNATWVASWEGSISGTSSLHGGGSIFLSGDLDIIRLNTLNGTDTFDAGYGLVRWWF